MRILSVAFRDMTVGTAEGGGAEMILSILERGLVERGHDSTVVAREGSRVAGRLLSQLEDLAQFDVIHFHGLDFPDYLPDVPVPMLATLHLPVAYYPAWIFERPHLTVNCVSRSQAASSDLSRACPVIPNGIRTADYTPHAPEEYLLWLGRICPEKGPHLALEVAHRTSRRLVVAGPVHPYPDHQRYFAEQVQPLLDNQRTYAGAVQGTAKRTLLAKAKCLLIPSLVAETSSLVAMEALACGTPVIAFRIGALPEVVTHGRTGFIVDDADQMAHTVARIAEIDRQECRNEALRRFDAEPMIDGYLALYRSIITRHLGTTSAPHENL